MKRQALVGFVMAVTMVASGCAHYLATTATTERLAITASATGEKERMFTARFEELMSRSGLHRQPMPSGIIRYWDQGAITVELDIQPLRISIRCGTQYYLTPGHPAAVRQKFEGLQKEIITLLSEVFGVTDVEWRLSDTRGKIGA
jgi:hypothetical protein